MFLFEGRECVSAGVEKGQGVRAAIAKEMFHQVSGVEIVLSIVIVVMMIIIGVVVCDSVIIIIIFASEPADSASHPNFLHQAFRMH